MPSLNDMYVLIVIKTYISNLVCTTRF